MSVLDLIIDCIKSLPTKTSVYATLISLVSAENADYLDLVLDRIKSELSHSFLRADYYALKLLLIFIAELSNCNIIAPSSVHGLCNAILESVLSGASMPQHLIDTYIFIIIIRCIIAAAKSIAPEDLLSKLEKVVKSRTSLHWFTPFVKTDSEPKTDIRIAEVNYTADKDWLQVVYEQFLEYLTSIGTSHQEIDLTGKITNGDTSEATNSSYKMRIMLQPWKMDEISKRLFGTPTEPKSSTYKNDITWFGSTEVNTMERDRLVTMEGWISVQNENRISHGLSLYIYPRDIPRCSFSKPRPNTYIFPKLRTSGEGKHALSDLERTLFADYLLDVTHFFKSTHGNISPQLSYCSHLSEFHDSFALILETLLLDMFANLASSHLALQYVTIVINYIFRQPHLNTTLNEAMDRLFFSISQLHPMSRQILATFLSLYINNNDYKWHWSDWAAMEMKPDSALPSEDDSSTILPTTSFIRSVISKIARLSYHERIATMIKASASVRAADWLGPKPDPPTASGYYASDLGLLLIDKVKSRPAKADLILELITSSESSVPLTSEEICKVLLRAILVDSSVTYTMMQSAIGFYAEVLRKVGSGHISSLPAPSNPSNHFLAAALEYSINSPQQFLIIASTLVSSKVITPEELLKFALEPQFVAEFGPSNLFWTETIFFAARYSLLSVRNLESTLTNQTLLAAKYEPSADPKLLAARTLDQPQSKEILVQLASASDAADALFQTLFERLLAQLGANVSFTGDKTKTILFDLLSSLIYTLASEFRPQLLSVLPKLGDTANSLPPALVPFYQNLRFYASNY